MGAPGIRRDQAAVPQRRSPDRRSRAQGAPGPQVREPLLRARRRRLVVEGDERLGIAAPGFAVFPGRGVVPTATIRAPAIGALFVLTVRPWGSSSQPPGAAPAQLAWRTRSAGGGWRISRSIRCWIRCAGSRGSRRWSRRCGCRAAILPPWRRVFSYRLSALPSYRPSMLARVRSAAVLGIDAYLVDVETDIANGLPTFATVGLPQGAVKEGRERVYAALANTGYTFPLKRITVNLAPADIRKDGCAFDLPIAVGILAATEQISSERLGRVAVLGELGLEGAIRPVRGALPVALAARTAGLEALVLPRENLPEAGVVSGVRVLGAGNLAELADFLDGRSELPEAQVDLAGLLAERAKHDVDFGEVKGQAPAKRALEVAAAGGHNIFTMGVETPYNCEGRAALADHCSPFKR